LAIPLKNSWKHRSLLFHFSVINIKMRFKGTYLGLLWSAIEPALAFTLLYVVFTTIRVRAGENFEIYLLTGIFIYHIFSRGTLAGINSLQANQGILKSFKIDKELFPVSSTLTTFWLMCVEVGVFFLLLGVFQFVPTWTAVFLPLVMLLLITLIMGLSYLFSIIFVYVKDVQQIWGIVVLGLFFISPILWYVNDAEGAVITLYQMNPVGQIIELAHKLIVFGQIPPIEDWAYTTTFVVGIFVVGYAIFQKFEKRLVEEI